MPTLVEPPIDSAPIRLGVININEERQRLMQELEIHIEEIQTREDVPAAWCTFKDPFGNDIGLYQDLS